MRPSIARSSWSASLLIGAALGLLGCYTVINHPKISPRDQVTERGNVIGQEQCSGCHTDAELWSFHHGSPWMARSDDYYYYRYDPYFLRRSWYGDRYYYSRWIAYYHNPWWFSTPGRYAWRPEPPAVGRGGLRDSAAFSQPRFFPLGGVGPRLAPFTSTSPPVATGFENTGARAKRDSSAAASRDDGRPVYVTPRYPAASPPVASQSASSAESSSTSSAQQKKQASNDKKKDDEPQSRGRGDARRGNGESRSR